MASQGFNKKLVKKTAATATALHLLRGAVTQVFPACSETIAFSFDLKDGGRLAFPWSSAEQPSDSDCDRIMTLVNAAITANIPVHVKESLDVKDCVSFLSASLTQPHIKPPAEVVEGSSLDAVLVGEQGSWASACLPGPYASAAEVGCVRLQRKNFRPNKKTPQVELVFVVGEAPPQPTKASGKSAKGKKKLAGNDASNEAAIDLQDPTYLARLVMDKAAESPMQRSEAEEEIAVLLRSALNLSYASGFKAANSGSGR